MALSFSSTQIYNRRHSFLRLKIAFYFVSVLFLTSCSSVPLSSMLKMATLKNDELLAIKPSEVRVRLSLSSPAELQTKDVRLALKFEHEGMGNSEYQYRLKLMGTQTINPVASWFGQQAKKFRYEFKLAALSKLEFKRFQKELVKLGTPDKYRWTVYYYLKNKMPDGEDISIDLELKLGFDEDYFYLLKKASVSIK